MFQVERLHVSPKVSVCILAVLMLGVSFMRPLPASAHWSMCLDDPKVWLDNGTKVDMQTVVYADPAVITHLTFTLHVPSGTVASRTVFTQNSSIETVNVVPDSSGGYSADVMVAASDGASYPVVLTLHVVAQSSSWVVINGLTGQLVSGPASAS